MDIKVIAKWLLATPSPQKWGNELKKLNRAMVSMVCKLTGAYKSFCHHLNLHDRLLINYSHLKLLLWH